MGAGTAQAVGLVRVFGCLSVLMIPPEDVRILLNSPVYYSKTNLYQK